LTELNNKLLKLSNLKFCNMAADRHHVTSSVTWPFNNCCKEAQLNTQILQVSVITYMRSPWGSSVYFSSSEVYH